MSKIRTVLLSLSVFFLTSCTAFAADLVNSDDVSYTIFIDLDNTSRTVTIAPRETITAICRDCYIEIDGNPDGVSIDNEEKVVIKGGNLIVEDEA